MRRTVAGMSSEVEVVSTPTVSGFSVQRSPSGRMPGAVFPAEMEPATIELITQAVTACDEAKGKDIVLLDVTQNFGLADFFMVASGRSDRHVQGIANRILDTLYQMGIEPFSVEGLDDGQWVVIDCVELVIHLFYGPNRERYDLETLWVGTKPVDLRALPKPITLKPD